MEYAITIQFKTDASALQAILRTLDSGPHGLMRPIVDSIVQQAQEQEKAAGVGPSAAPAAEPEAAGLTD